MKFPNMKQMQGALLNQAYNAYCFGFDEGDYEREKLSLSEFCKRIKEVNEAGAKLHKKSGV